MSENSKNQNSKISGPRKFLANTASIFASTVINRTATFIVYVLIGRNFGAFEFGQVSLALTLFQSFQILSTGGLLLLLTREIAKDKTKAGHYLLHGFMIVTVLAILSILGVSIFALSMNYVRSTIIVIFLVSLSLLPYSLSVLCDAVIQAWEKMHIIAISYLFANVFKIAAAVLLIINQYNINYIVSALFIAHLIGLIIKLILMYREITISHVVLKLRSCLDIMKSSVTFWGIRASRAIESSLVVILLSKLVGETEVGLFNAANQLLVPVALVMESTIVSVYPIMCRRFDSDFGNIKQILENLLQVLMSLILPVGIVLYFASDWLLIFIYDKADFLQSAAALRILIAALLLRILTLVLGRFLIAGLKEKITLRIVFINLIMISILGPILISHYQLTGAVCTTVIVRAVNMVQHLFAIWNLGIKVDYYTVFWKPILAGIIMVSCLLNMNFSHPLISVTVAFLVYYMVYLLLMIYDAGGIKEFKLKCQSLLAKY